MKIIKIVILALLAFGCKEETKKVLNEQQNAELVTKNHINTDTEWVALFDGKSFNGWHEYGKKGVSDHWKIEEGAMVFYPPKNRGEKEIFDLLTDNEYTNFVLSIDWKISEGGNSGIFWGINEVAELKPYETGPEIQILDNANHPDAKNGESHQAGALYDMVAPAKDATKPVGEWNTCVITIDHTANTGSAVLNGEKMVDFQLSGSAWNTMVATSKFFDWEFFGKYPTGKLGLQDHGNVVAFKNIKIKQL